MVNRGSWIERFWPNAVWGVRLAFANEKAHIACLRAVLSFGVAVCAVKPSTSRSRFIISRLNSRKAKQNKVFQSYEKTRRAQ